MAVNLVNKLIEVDNNLKEDKKLLQELYDTLQDSSQGVNNVPCPDDKEKTPVVVKNLLSHSHSKDDVEAYFLGQFRRVSLSIPKTNISDFLVDKDTVCQFVCIVFERHYGWTEKCSTGDNLTDQIGNTTSCRNELNVLYEKWIVWLESHDYLSYYLLSGYKYAFESCRTLAIVRKQIVFSLFRWFKNLSGKYLILPDKCFKVLKGVVLHGLTDVWSAIRKDTASRLGLVLEFLSEEQLEDLFLSLIQICENEKGSWQRTETWQATEGAIRGIDKMLTSCKYIATSSVRKDDRTSSPSVLIKIGRNNFPSLPQYVKENMEKVLFKLFAHPQFSIREVAGKAFSTFLNKSEFSYLVESFEKIVQHLGIQNKENLVFMDACEAEGFMNAVLFLIKSIPLTHLIHNWQRYWSVFTHYLIHPASTVRQTASSVFKYLVSKDLTSLYQMKLVLQGLCSEWKTDIEALKGQISSCHQKQFEGKGVSDHTKTNDITLCWEWREGRLLAYELIMKFLITNYLYFSLTSTSHHIHHKKNNSLNNSITEGQFRLDSLKNSITQPTRVDLTRKTLTKSFTISRLGAVDSDFSTNVNNAINATTTNDSLLEIARSEKIEKEKFLNTAVPTLKLTPLPNFPSGCETMKAAEQNAEQQISNWLSQQEYCSYYNLLKQTLIQTIECLHDSRWELRRMSRQLLPNICEVIRLYNYQLLEDLYVEATNLPGSELYYGSCFCLLNSIKSYIKLNKMTSDKFLPAKSVDKRRSNAEDMMLQIEKNMATYVLSVSKHITHSCETSNMSVVILVLYKITFKKEECVFDKIICDYLHELSNSIKDDSSPTYSKSSSKHLLDLLCETQIYLLEYCDSSPVQFTSYLLPVFLQAVHLSQTNSLDVHVMLACCENILRKTLRATNEDARSHSFQLESSCQEICQILENTELEVQYLRQVFNITFALQSTMANEFPLSTITNSLNSKLAKIGSCKRSTENFVSQKIDSKSNAQIPDDLLSYSTASFDSIRMSDGSSSDGNSDKEHGEEVDEASDWDWSSGDEDNKDESSLFEIYSSFLEELNDNTPRQDS